MYLIHILMGIAIGYFLFSCKSSKDCDAYGSVNVRGYDYVQVVGIPDTIPTLGVELMHLPQGEYEIIMWSDTKHRILKIKI